MASLNETTDGKWDVRWRLPNGADRQKRFATKRQATAWLKQVTTTAVDTKAGRTTFDDVASAALAAKTLKPNTLASYQRIVEAKLLPTFGGMQISKIASADIVAWQASLPKRSANTTRNWQMTLSKVLRYAHRQGLITSNPMDALATTAVASAGPRRVARFLTATEVDKLALELVADADLSLATLVRFAAWTGLRAGELTALTVGDVDLRRNVVFVSKTAHRRNGAWEVTTPKSARSTRDVPIAPHVVEFMLAFLAHHPRKNEPNAPLWPGRMKGGLTPGAVDWTKPHEHGTFYQRHFKPATVATGLAPLRFHDLRHTFASLCAEAGVPIHKVSRWMGHANVSTTDMIYTHLFADNDADLAKLTRLAGK
jgi:integrase